MRDSAATACALLTHEDALDNGAPDSANIDTRVIVKAGILGGDEGIGQVGRHLVEIDIDAVAATAVVTAHLHTVGTIDGRGELIGGVLQLVDGRHVTDHAIIN